MIALTTNLTSLWPWCSWIGRSRNAKKWQALQFQITFCLHDYGPFTFVSFIESAICNAARECVSNCLVSLPR